MTDTEDTVHQLRREIHHSTGMQFVRRMRVRSSCLRMFTMNAHRLEEVFLILDGRSSQLLFDDSMEVQKEAKLAITYLLHNFLASGKTIVDQTRIFIKAFYSGTPVETSYKARVADDIANDKMCRFVQDLRNYVLHCGMPPISLWTSLGSHNDANAGYSLSLQALREWSGWTSLSKEFLQEHPENTLDPDDLARSYCHKVITFHVWLDECLTQYHRKDLALLDDLNARLKVLSNHPYDAEPRTWDDWRPAIKFNALPWRPIF